MAVLIITKPTSFSPKSDRYFYEQLELLNNFLIQEWRKQGNSIESFKDNSAKILVILDNASFHKRKDILAHLVIQGRHNY
ncbi:hypothetical protein [Nostoc sp. UCD121]|uniref:hypothetical protein n=1 Tax=Nostoc sp. UCD121 TaxID=2681305 RepID=UPI001627F0C3|nr:hypothetical protein [Nostoc sp. UCD121]